MDAKIPPLPEIRGPVTAEAVLAVLRRLVIPGFLGKLYPCAVTGPGLAELVLGKVPEELMFVYLDPVKRDLDVGLVVGVGYRQEDYALEPPRLKPPGLPRLLLLASDAGTLREAIMQEPDRMGLELPEPVWHEGAGALEALRLRGEPLDYED